MFRLRLAVARRASALAVLVVTVLLAAGCEVPTDDQRPPPTAEGSEHYQADTAPAAVVVAPASSPSSGGETMLVRLGAEETGIVHQNVLPLERTGHYLYVGAGVAAGDYDGDGLPDLYLVSQTGQNKLYRNLGNWQFEDVTAAAGVEIARDVEGGRFETRYPMGAYFFDYDNDGDLDLFVTAFAGANTLFRNDGDGTFTDVSAAAGVDYVGASTTAAFADYDRDGDVDIYLATYRPYGETKYYPPGTAPGPEPELVYDLEEIAGEHYVLPEADILYRNEGDGTFTDVTEAAGIGKTRDWGLAASFADVNGDGWPDLYVSNDFETPDRFFLNNGDGTFRPVDKTAYRHTPMFSMGMDFGDINNDGWLDFMTSDMLSPSRLRRQVETMEGLIATSLTPPADSAVQIMRNSLFVNNGDGTFTDVAPFAGVMATDWTWTVKFADLDLDGWSDLLVTNGFVNDAMNADERLQIAALKVQGRDAEVIEMQRNRPPLLTSNFVYRNAGGLQFEDMSREWGFDDDAVANGLALADFDGDGDLDVVVNNMNAPAGVYRNDAQNLRLAVRLRGIASNSFGIGARLTLETAEGTQTREMAISGGYLSSHEPVVVFGLGETHLPKRLTIAWPSGHASEITELDAGGLITVTEPVGEADIAAPPLPNRTQFEEVAVVAGIDFVHSETEYDDFADQPLLPYRLSTFGPGVAWGDLDGDGRDDLYVAGAAGQPSGLFRNKGDGAFERLSPVAPPGGGLEPQAGLWWPAESGAALIESLSSAEAPTDGTRPIARALARGGGGLTATDWQAVGTASGGALAAADYDGDGHLDLFVGGRYLPAAYPMAVDSRLFRGGEQGLTEDLVNGAVMAQVGMVTAALWRDLDGDGDPDLVLATDWGPLRFLRNDSGRLTDATATAGLADLRGWWNGLAAGDVDHDGDIDLVATNLGLNTRYRAHPERPLVMFAGDIDGDGDVDLVETEWDGERLHAMRQLTEFGRDMPFVLDRFANFRSFAVATVEQVLGEARLARAERLEADTLAHTLFLNDGTGVFDAHVLPTAAQLQTGYGVTLTDFDADGHLDLYLVGNLSATEPMHTGPLDNGVSVFLRGDGTGVFEPVAVTDSGLSVPADGRGLAIADIDDDGWPDIAVGVNDGRLRLFRNRGVAGHLRLALRLVGPAGNPNGVGALITVNRSDGVTLTAEVGAGGSFLSQDGTRQLFGLGESGGPVQVVVRWPDGTVQTLDGVDPVATPLLTIERAEAAP